MELITQMLEELCALSTEISNDDVEMLCTEIRGARRVYLAGRGRSGLISKMFISDKQSLNLSRFLSFVLVAFSLIMCLFFTDTLTWLVATAGLSASVLLCPIFVSYLLRKKHFVTNTGIIAGMVCGAAGGVIGMILQTTINYAALGILFSFIGMIAVSAMTKKSGIINAE